MRTVRDIPECRNIPVLVRATLNVPVVHGKVANDYRLRRALPTIQYLRERHAKIILISHITGQGTETLAPAAEALGNLIPGVSFCPDTIGARTRAAIRDLIPGNILVLENVRRNKGEITNSPLFAQELAALADIFVQDSFDECHRAYASIVGIPHLLPSYAGLLFEEEKRELSRALLPEHPALAVIGGAKFGTKEAVLETLLAAYDRVFVGGALADDFLKASGVEVGRSLVSDGDSAYIKKLLKHPGLVLPVDSVVIPASAVGTKDARMKARVAPFGDVRPDEIILDDGPDSVARITDLAQKAKTVLWNGPLGNYENGFTDATLAFARALAASKAHSIVGGGDTIASIEGLGLLPQFSFVSTGGGAMLEYLTRGTLPGIEALAIHASA